MNDQEFVNEYIRILNETVNEAITKNIVMQAQLSLSKKQSERILELETRIRELTSVSSDINALKSQLDHANLQLNNKNSHFETFKRELVESRNIIKESAREKDSLNAEIESLKQQIDELKSRKKKKEKALNTVAIFEETSDSIAVSETF